MAHILNVRGILSGNPEKDAEILTNVLQDVQQILTDNITLSQKVNFSLKMKGSQEKTRLRKLLTLEGPDPETLKLLEDSGPLWLQDPEEFWKRPPRSKLAQVDPQTHVVGLACILLLELRKEFPVPSDGETAAILHNAGVSSDDIDKLKEKIQGMVAEGSRYKNMEKELGLGVAFVLGTSISESSWTKLLPKSGPKFTEVIDHAKKTKLPVLATRYSSLRKAVIETRLGVYRRSQYSSVTVRGSSSFRTSEMI